MNKKFIVRLSDEERLVCREIIKKLKGSSQKVRRVQILLKADKADADGPAWSDGRIAEAFDCRTRTIENVRKSLVVEGFEQALERKKRADPPTPCKLDGEAEAKLIAMRLGKPPAGYGHWTLQLLADEMVTLEVVDGSIPKKGYARKHAFTTPVEQTDARKEPGLPHWSEEKRWQPIDDGYSQKRVAGS